ncbi:CLUMA_CG008528, isoform A [Clunio marinus]|uniref:CLUMA_CG008528, isoform A n=1 Tax=Clunio marinus TaxID=568069 RepID=A0A1J1I427_9DIPT|nr:CLUMA_CG008528, isoform A [Clunio marinus]
MSNVQIKYFNSNAHKQISFLLSQIQATFSHSSTFYFFVERRRKKTTVFVACLPRESIKYAKRWKEKKEKNLVADKKQVFSFVMTQHDFI